MARSPRPKVLSPEDCEFMSKQAWAIIVETAEKYLCDPAMIIGSSRYSQLVAARVEVAKRLYEERGYALTRIGKVLGNRNHATVLFYLGRLKHHPLVAASVGTRPAELMDLRGQRPKRLPKPIEQERPRPVVDQERPKRRAKKFKVPYAGYDANTYEWQEVEERTP